MKKLLNIGVWFLLLAYFLLMSGFVSKHQDERICNAVEVIIADSLSHKFISSDEVKELLDKAGVKTLGESITKVNTKKVEQVLLKENLIESCSAYKTVDGKLYVEVYQKTPILKIITQFGGKYYLDNKGDIFATKSKYSPRIIVASGSISIPMNLSKCSNIFEREYYKEAAELRQLFDFVTYIDQSEFWEAQIEQIYRDKNGDWELVPRVGPHLIQMGSLDNFKDKLWKLDILYKEGFSRVGWNEYLYINLKFKDQIVCTKN